MSSNSTWWVVKWPILAAIFTASAHGNAETYSDGRSYIYDQPINEMQISVQYQYIDENLDFLDFASKSSTTSRLKSESTFDVGFSWRINRDYAILATGFRREAEIVRTVEPTSLDGLQQSLSLGVRRFFNDDRHSIQLRLNYFDVDDLTINKYQQGDTILGEDVVLLDPESLTPLPVGEFGMRENGVEIGYLRSFDKNETRFGISLSYRYSNVNPGVSSVLFNVTDPIFLGTTVNDQTIGSIIERFRNTLPQTDDWQEHIFSAGIAMNRSIAQDWSTSWSLRGYAIERDNYQKGLTEKEITSNFVLDGAIVWTPRAEFSVYLNGRIYSNYLAGTDPGVYNRRIAHLFDNAFGTLAVGATYRF